jgi:hypothetical protein
VTPSSRSPPPTSCAGARRDVAEVIGVPRGRAGRSRSAPRRDRAVRRCRRGGASRRAGRPPRR